MTPLAGVLLVATMILARVVYVLVQRQRQTEEELRLLLESVHLLCVHTGLAAPIEERAHTEGDLHGSDV